MSDSWFGEYGPPLQIALVSFLVLTLIFILPAGVIHYRRYGTFADWRGLVIYSFIFYLFAVVALAIFPLPETSPELCALYRAQRNPQFTPFGFVGDIWRLFGRRAGLAEMLRDMFFLLPFFNFLMLLPLGFYAWYLLKWHLPKTALIAFLISLAIEVGQLTAIYGLYPCPYRQFDIDDMILNTSGAVVGFLIAPLITFLPNLGTTQQETQP